MEIKQKTLPNMDPPTVLVLVTQPSASTEEIKSGVAKPNKDSLMRVVKYELLTSTSAENAANIVAHFPFGSDID